MKPKRAIILTVVLLLGVATLAGVLQLHQQMLAAGPATTTQDLRIAPGSSLRAALRGLQDHGLIRHPRLLEVWLRCCNEPTRQQLPDIHAGHYRIEAGQPALAVLNQLFTGRVILEQLTFVEGWNLQQVRKALAQHPAIEHRSKDVPATELLQHLGYAAGSAEGRFAPDTYRFEENSTDTQILRMAYEAQQKRLKRAWEGRAANLPLATADEALTLASIVEKETGLASERAQIAGVFINRLRKGMRLQSDPTVIYGLFDRYEGDIRKRDLIADTPWNTYTRTGLPPTPIAMPGEAAIQATLAPAVTDALYFVAQGDGSGAHQFSAGIEQHNQAVARYLQRLRQSKQAK